MADMYKERNYFFEGVFFMKRIFSIALALTMMAGVFTGCGATSSAATDSSTEASSTEASSTEASSTEAEASTLEGTVTVGGSTSVESVVLSAIEIFMEQNPGVTITYDPTGSSTGVKSAASGDYDIGLASRDVKDTETAEMSAVGTVFAIDGIAIILNTANTVEDLSLEQITGIADGSITNWSEVGGEDAPIVLIGREAGSGTRDGFESIVGVDECVYEQEIASTGGVIGAVQQNPNAIGYASLASVDEKVKAITVEGVAATEATIQDGTYKVQRNFNFVTIEGKDLSPAAQAFFDFVLSAEASELVSNAGAVPVT